MVWYLINACQFLFYSDDVTLIKIILHCSQVPPYEPRIFPLLDEVYEKMLKAMPEGHPFPPYSMAPKKLFTKDNEMVTSLPIISHLFPDLVCVKAFFF
jgi:hypothetical protein